MHKSPSFVVLFISIAIAGCSHHVDFATHESATTGSSATTGPPNSTEATERPHEFATDVDEPKNTPRDLRAGGTLPILDAPPADRADLLAAYAEAIRDQPFKYRDVGAVLEALAVEGMQRIYPAPAHEVISGIEYADGTGRTLGELDIVVFLTATGDAVMVSEVKLSSNLERAASKADSQLRRFRNAISNQQVATIRHKSRKELVYKPANFENVLRYGKVGSRGAVDQGFDWEIDLTREEGDQLQRLLLKKTAAVP